MAEQEGAPAWMVSFGDMMTLILTFFILLVSMSRTQEIGLVAQGVGSFMVAVRSFGMPGVLSAAEEAAQFDAVRMRFNLPPENDPERRDEHTDASNLELIRAKAAKALRPHDEIPQPAIAIFDEGSAELTEQARRYINLLAPTLLPAPKQVLQVEGHAPSNEKAGNGKSPRWLAFARAKAVRDYLIEQHSFPPTRVEARAWLAEITDAAKSLRTVDARLILPTNADANTESD